MSGRLVPAALLTLNVDRALAPPLAVQLYQQLRELILGGRLQAGVKLPSSRVLSAELGVSRTTVIEAFEQLRSEGYVEGRHGAGTFVPPVLPEMLLTTRGGGRRPREAEPPRLSSLARRLAGRPRRPGEARAFNPGLPETGLIPFELWSRAMARAWRRPAATLLAAAAPGGDPALRRAIAGHLGAMRGIDCTAEQVVLTSSAREAVALAARTLLEPGDQVWVEDPGYPAVRQALTEIGLVARGLPIDAEGLSLEAGLAGAPAARMAVVTPSRQYPLGTTMTLARRLALLDWARDRGAWIVEDDYDSEYRYAGRPLSALQSLDEAGRVLYLGSFSKVLFPKLRLGYLVLPPGLTAPLLAVREEVGAEPSMIAQPVLAEFIESGGFAVHIRRMRRLYAERQTALLAALSRHAEGLLTAERQDGGMHLVAELAPALARRLDDRAIEARARAAGIAAPALSAFYRETPPRHGLMLGYAGAPADELDTAMARLVALLRP
jgi:GntR family transcriptional regulator / MocR family aminotransferase